ncbi:helix-turn-helix domain-containing protein [Clostridium sp. BJN0013]|mgnify:CR=1 FL=1|uniref:helix-turn-helix domain-containing protein n=1 Tax=Clostridium sp. BJN0013 TaxID=3236840 RepID=UPI0034C6BF7D
MKKRNDRINYYAEKSDFEEVYQVLKNNSDKRMYIRYIVILNYLQGYKLNEIAYMNNISSQTVDIYVKKYKLLGLNDLDNGQKFRGSM